MVNCVREKRIELKLEKGNLQKEIRKFFNIESISGVSFTLAEIGEFLGITRERVRQIENSAIKKLKHPKSTRKLREMNYE